MELELILGPMKSGKSYDLISRFAPLKYTDIPFALFQSARNVRDDGVTSRNGVLLEAKKISSLHEILLSDYKIVGIDEAHMFADADVEAVNQLLKKGVKVIVAGLDLDYKGKLFGIIQGLLELAPARVHHKRAVCECCKNLNATHTQVLRGVDPITFGMPSVIPDDGTYFYKAVCRDCFVKI